MVNRLPEKDQVNEHIYLSILYGLGVLNWTDLLHKTLQKGKGTVNKNRLWVLTKSKMIGLDGLFVQPVCPFGWSFLMNSGHQCKGIPVVNLGGRSWGINDSNSPRWTRLNWSNRIDPLEVTIIGHWNRAPNSPELVKINDLDWPLELIH